ncbi:hypothetical protein V2G26_018842 [Clonostachys chloroleuca]
MSAAGLRQFCHSFLLPSNSVWRTTVTLGDDPRALDAIYSDVQGWGLDVLREGLVTSTPTKQPSLLVASSWL